MRAPLLAQLAAVKPVDALRTARWQRQRSRPPRCPRRWTVGPPDFVGVGAQKAGTSWWYRLIARHPGVTARGHPKELYHFQPGEWSTEYARWFPRRPGTLSGEWSTGYLHHPTVLEQLAVAAPDARILVLLRDPVERYVSGVTMYGAGRPEVEDDHARRGLYAHELDRLFRFFARERTLVLQYERCRVTAGAELARTYRFLGLDDSFVPRQLHRGVNVTMAEKAHLNARRRRELVDFYEADVRRLCELVPDLDVSLWPHFAGLG